MKPRNAMIPNPTRRGGLTPATITDRGLRYRASRNPPPGPRICHYCGGPGPDVEHVDGFEEHDAPENLSYACRSCNTQKGIVFKNAGRGRLTRQFNPAGGARNAAQWRAAVQTLTGRGGRLNLADAIARVQNTPHQKRAAYARQLNPYSFEKQQRRLRENIEAIEKQLGRKVTDAEYVQLARMVGEIQPEENPAAKIPTYEQYVRALKMHTKGAHDEGGAVIHATPPAVRRDYQSRINAFTAPKRRAAHEERARADSARWE